MASYRGHILGGLVAYGVGIVCSVQYGTVTHLQAAEWLLCALLGSLFPDIDIKSKGQKLVYSLLCLVMLMCLLQGYVVYAALLGIVACIPLMTHHRSLCHSWWFLCAMIFFGALFLSYHFPAAQPRIVADSFFFALGVASHLVIDGKMLSLRGKRK